MIDFDVLERDRAEYRSTLRDAAVDKVRQVRASALAALATIASGDAPVAAELAASILVQVLRGGLQSGSIAASEPNIPEGASVVASKVEEAASDRITITRDGEIVPVGKAPHHDEDAATPEIDAPHEEAAFPTSTLEAIQSPLTRVSDVTEEPLSEDELEHLSASRGDAHKRRVAVDGPKDVVDDARRVTLRIAAPCPSPAIGEVLCDIVKTGSPDLRGAAVEAIVLRAAATGLDASLAEAAVEMLSDQEPLVRGHAARAVGAAGADVQGRLLPLLRDPDAVVRAAVLQTLPSLAAEHAGIALADASPLVRQTVLDRLIESDADLAAAMAICLETRWTAGMSKACEASAGAREFILDVLTSHEAEPGQ